jgi:hypothetical protein
MEARLVSALGGLIARFVRAEGWSKLRVSVALAWLAGLLSEFFGSLEWGDATWRGAKASSIGQSAKVRVQSAPAANLNNITETG